MKTSAMLLSGFVVLTLGLLGQPAQATPLITTFEFTGLCDDCAGPEGAEIEAGENLDDGFFQSVSGELVLWRYTPGDDLVGGLNELDPAPETEEEQDEEESAKKAKQEQDAKQTKKQKVSKKINYFHYNGSDLVGDFTVFFTDAVVHGQIFADGTLGRDLSINTKAYSILIQTDGNWSITFGRDKKQKQPTKKAKKLDIGVNAAFAQEVPAPGALALLGVGLLGLGLRRRIG